MPPCYGRRGLGGRPLSAGALVGATLASVVGAWSADGRAAVPLAAGIAMVVAALDEEARRWMAVVIVLVAATASWRGAVEWARLEPTTGPYAGVVRVVEEPRTYGRATRAIVVVEGERFEIWARGARDRAVLTAWRGGDRVTVRAERLRLTPRRASRVAWQHVVGELRVHATGQVGAGSAVDRVSNRVRITLERAAAVLPGHDGSLFRGLVVGDDREQPADMVDRFRASGLSHLTAVSGQNISFLLAAVAPLVRRLPPWGRWSATIVAVAWFVSLTRFEPSIVRAGVMAAISATAFMLGRDRSPARILCSAVTILVLVDPLLVRSVGFWLSVGATAGVCTVGPWLRPRLVVVGPLATPLGVTLGAQVGVVVPMLVAFGRLPLVSVPANLLAVPAAGFVMLYGLPAGLVAGAVPVLAPALMLPVAVAVRWVDTVATVAERCEPPAPWSWIGWVVLVGMVVVIAAMNRNRHGSPPAHR